MTKASDNDFPSILLTEQGSAPTSPAASHQRLYIRTSDHTLVTVNSSGTVTPVSSGGTVTFCGAKAYSTSTQSITASTITPLTFTSEEYDTDAIHDTGSNTSRFTVPSGKGGKWLLQGGTLFSGNPVLAECGFRLNGTTLIRGTGVVRLETSGSFASAHTIVALSVADYVEFWCYTVTGSINAGNAGGAHDAESWAAATFMG